MKLFRHGALLLIAGTLISTPVYAQFEGLSMMRMGAWEVDFSGNVNGFATFIDCDDENNGRVAGGLACGSNGNDREESNFQTGLLPSWLNFYAGTVTDSGVKTAVHLSFQPGIDSSSPFGGPLDGALGLNAANFRQVFLTMGTDTMGTFKIGRDLGVFGGNAILEDMTLLGVGTVSDLTIRGGNTTLGRIGVGYLYADWKSQIQYTSPNWDGFSFTAAVADPWGVDSLAAAIDPIADANNPGRIGNPYSASNEYQENDTYGFEAKVNYAFDGDSVSGHAWASYIQQEIDFSQDLDSILVGTVTFTGNDSADADGFDVGAKLVFGGLDLVGYYYDGEGIGTTGFLLDGIDACGDERDSDGYYFQARYRMPGVGTLLGVSFGESTLDETEYDEANLADARSAAGIAAGRTYDLVDTTESWIIGAYHPIGEALNLVVEYTETEAESHSGNEAEESSFAIGAIMFF